MRYLEGQRLGKQLDYDVRVIELAQQYGWLPSQVRREDWRDLQLLSIVEEAQRKAKAELKRRADEQKKQAVGKQKGG